MDRKTIIIGLAVSIFILVGGGLWFAYESFRIDVPQKHIAVLIKKTGKDITNNMSVSPSPNDKGVQKDILTEGRYFYNFYNWDWRVYPMVEVPTGMLGVRVRLYGDNLPYGEIIAWDNNQKGIVPEVLRPGRYAINACVKGNENERPVSDYIEYIELHSPITVPAGFLGVVTNLAAPMPKNPNTVLTEDGKRGVQKQTLQPGTYYANPYLTKIDLVDCRSQRYNLAQSGDFGFPSKDGFWVKLDGIIEYRVKQSKAAEVYVLYNEETSQEPDLKKKLVQKVILPNARSFCRLRGSDNVGRDFIGGETRTKFQQDFQIAMREACDPLGIEVVQALITQIEPPEAIATPIRNREVALQKLGQYKQQIQQQLSEQGLAVENAKIKQKQAIVAAEQDVVTITIKAKQEQSVAVTKANENLGVAKFKLNAAKDQAAAIVARGKANADVIVFQNQAIAAGWQRACSAFSGDGHEYAQYILYQKLAPGFRKIMANTSDSPLMKIFERFNGSQLPTPIKGGCGQLP